MGQVIEKACSVDVICQHKADGTVIPLRLRVRDEDGVYQVYQIKAYREVSNYGTYLMPNESVVTSTVRKFECKITVFRIEKMVVLYYNSYDNIWRLQGD